MDYRARILVHSDDEDQPVLAIPITGTGVVGATPDINLPALSLDFGTVPKNDTETGYFAIQNVGDGALEIVELELEDGPFEIVVIRGNLNLMRSPRSLNSHRMVQGHAADLTSVQPPR